MDIANGRSCMSLEKKGHGDMRGAPPLRPATDGVLRAASPHVSRRTVRPRPQRQTRSRDGVTPPSLSALTRQSRCPPEAKAEQDGLRSKGPGESHGISRRSPGDVEGRGVSSSGDAMTTMATALMDRWETLPWKQLQRNVFKLPKRIYRAARRDDRRTVHRLQRLLMKSRSARLLAVRRVAQENHGKRSAGVDGVKSLTPSQRLVLAQTLRLGQKAQPVRRVWIPKPQSTERRPLGIPVMANRAGQVLVTAALEPKWEGRFEPNSYGFRPGRSCQDALRAIYNAVRHQAKYVLDADIEKCFDRICHEELLTKVHTSPTLRRQLKAWLKVGVLDHGEWFPTPAGTIQGAPISPLLANVALHGLETVIITRFPRQGTFLPPPSDPLRR